MKLINNGGKFYSDDANVILGDISNEFIRMGYSEEDSEMLADLAINSAVSYGGVLDVIEASNSLIRAINGFDTRKLNDIKQGF